MKKKIIIFFVACFLITVYSDKKEHDKIVVNNRDSVISAMLMYFEFDKDYFLGEDLNDSDYYMPFLEKIVINSLSGLKKYFAYFSTLGINNVIINDIDLKIKDFEKLIRKNFGSYFHITENSDDIKMKISNIMLDFSQIPFQIEYNVSYLRGEIFNSFPSKMKYTIPLPNEIDDLIQFKINNLHKETLIYKGKKDRALLYFWGTILIEAVIVYYNIKYWSIEDEMASSGLKTGCLIFGVGIVKTYWDHSKAKTKYQKQLEREEKYKSNYENYKISMASP